MILPYYISRVHMFMDITISVDILSYSAYSTHGCFKIDEDERSVSCQSNHTTSFVILLQVTSYPVDETTVCYNCFQIVLKLERKDNIHCMAFF